MKLQVLLILAVFVACSLGQQMTNSAQKEQLESVSVNDLLSYNKWKFNNNKHYFSADEASYRQILFLKNLQKINKHNNKKDKTYTVGVNQFTDLTQEEFAEIALNPVLADEPNGKLRNLQFYQGSTDGTNQGSTNSTTGEPDCKLYPERCQTTPPPPPPPEDPLKDVPQSVDWRTLNKVSPVKNQGGCGSCWAFSTIGLLESVNLLRNNNLTQYSEQELVDCTYKQPNYYNYGCQGGWPSTAHRYIQDKGISLSKNYIYRGVNQNCTITPNSPPKALFAGTPIYPWANNQNRTNTVQYAVSIQPLSVLVDATNWSSYRSGVFSNCGTRINHAVLLVGYTPEGNWIVKNSWGTGWGQAGYITLAPGNTCNILSSPLGSTI